MARGKVDRKGSGIVIRRIEVVEGRHHGGAWKVAYADFVTAMMAFFLLMWLLNATTEDQRKGLADYFSPNNLLSHASSGTGQPFGGKTAFDDGALVSDRGSVQITAGKRQVQANAEAGETEVQADPREFVAATTSERTEHQQDVSNAALLLGRTGVPIAPTFDAASQAADAGHPGPTESELRAERARQEKAAFEQAAQQIRDAVKDDPALAELARQLAIDMTPEGLRIQIMDEVQLPMFATGSADPNDRARLLLRKIVPVLARLTQAISISGHTDSAPFPSPGRTNWELSAERANATRRLLVEGGLPDGRFRTVTGHADRDPLQPNEPLAAANRRISILVLRETQASPR